jgi:Na+-driven multidrug efflux pump
MAWTLWTGWTDLRLGVRPSKLFVADRGVWRSIAKIGGPPQIGRLTNFVAFGFIVGLVLRESAMLAAAFGVAYRLLTVASTAGYGFSRAQAIIAGQCIGAGKHDRAIASLWVACMLALIVGLALIVLAPLATPLVRLFTTDVRVVAATMDALASWRWIVLAASAWYIFLAAYSATARVGVASAMTVVSDLLAVSVMLALGTPQSSAALWAIATQHVARAVLLALLLRPAFLTPLAAGGSRTLR